MFRIFGSFIFVMLIAVGALHADSDRYYCVGPGYIAYQFGMAAPGKAPHRLHVVRYPGGRIASADSIQLPQFQVHGMRCRADGVDVVSWDAVHSVAFDARGRLARSTEAPLAARGRLPEWIRGTENLTRPKVPAHQMPERRSLEKDRAGFEYLLEIAVTPNAARDCPPFITARVLILDQSRRERAARVLYHGNDAPECKHISLAPVEGTPDPRNNPADVLLDALVFGPYRAEVVTPYPPELRAEFVSYLRRLDQYHTSRPPAVGGEALMVDAERVNYEGRLVAAARDTGVAALAVAYVDSLRPCYEWEGYHDCPERDALFAEKYQQDHPDSPFRDYLPLLAAHRWLCTAEGYDYEKRPVEAARSRAAYTRNLAVARASPVLSMRTAGEYLAQRASCFKRD
ncbi:MAG: hypothetical protein ACREMA_07185 [Longimicrobiales bacterium]